MSGRNPELANNGTFWERWGRDVALAVNDGRDGTGSVLVFNVGIHFNLGQGQSEAEAEFGQNYYRRVVREVCRVFAKINDHSQRIDGSVAIFSESYVQHFEVRMRVRLQANLLGMYLNSCRKVKILYNFFFI